MLTTIITTSASAISMMTVVGLGVGGGLLSLFLITLLSSKELLSASSIDFDRIASILNTAIFPLLFAFGAIVLFKVISLGII